MTESPPSRPPYRTHLREASPSLLEERNLAEGRSGAALLLPTEQALEKVQKSRLLELTVSELDALTEHPDERVRLAFVEAFCSGHSALAADYRGRLVRQLAQEYRDEGVSWTPLFDHLASYGLWPRGTRDVPSPREQALGMGEWLATQAEEADFNALLTSFYAAEPIEALAETYPNLSLEQVERLKRWHPPGSPYKPRPNAPLPPWYLAVTRNRQLPAETVDALFQQAAESLGTRQAAAAKALLLGLVRTGYPLPPELRRSLARQARQAPPVCVLPLEVLLQDPSTPPEALKYILPRALESTVHATLLVAHRAATTELWQQALDHVEDLTVHLAAHPGRLRPELLREIYERDQEVPGTLARLLERRDLPRALLQRIAEEASRHNRTATLHLLAHRADLRRLPEVRPVLRGRQEGVILTGLLLDQDAGDFAVLFRRLVALDPVGLTSEVLPRVCLRSEWGLTPADLAPLMQSEHQEIRLAAIGALGQLMQSPSSPELAPGRGGRT